MVMAKSKMTVYVRSNQAPVAVAPKKQPPALAQLAQDESVDVESTQKLELEAEPQIPKSIEMPPSAEPEAQSQQTRLDAGQGPNLPTAQLAPQAAPNAPAAPPNN